MSIQPPMNSSVRVEDSYARGTRAERRAWLRPSLEPHSTMTVVTQLSMPIAMSLLFQQSSQCFNSSGGTVPCP